MKQSSLRTRIDTPVTISPYLATRTARLGLHAITRHVCTVNNSLLTIHKLAAKQLYHMALLMLACPHTPVHVRHIWPQILAGFPAETDPILKVYSVVMENTHQIDVLVIRIISLRN